ncbi:MAG: hypothetical protein K0M46_01445 [Thiobacillus sp.]|nr:hypothetical protein [Thiobacillus sp.]
MHKRSELLQPVRAMIDEVKSVCNAIRNSYPLRYPVPPEIDSVLKLEDSLIAQARGGKLKHATLNDDKLNGDKP